MRGCCIGIGFAGQLTICLWAQDSATVSGNGMATFGTSVVVPGGLRGQIYYVKEGTWLLPKFEKLKPVGAIYTSELNVTPRHWLAGFPGVTTRFEWFAIDYRGRFWIDEPGNYRFSLESDDGSKLYIDERLVINNDSQHPALIEHGRAELRAGIHDIRVSYFQGPRDEIALVLKVAPPGRAWKVFNTNDFRPPPNPEDWQPSEARTLKAPAPDTERRRLGDVAALAALDARPQRRDFEFHVALFHFASLGSSSQCAMVFEIPPNSLVPLTGAKGEPAPVNVSLLARIKDADGHVADQRHADLSGVSSRPLTSSHAVVLPAGRYTLEAVVMDLNGTRVSTSITPLDVVEPRGGIGLSSVMLARAVEPVDGVANDPLVYQGLRLVPLLDPVLSEGERPSAYFFVYPDRAGMEPPKLRVELLADGRLVAKKEGDLPMPDPSGTIPMHLETAASPGNWELRITAMQGADAVTQSVRYSYRAAM